MTVAYVVLSHRNPEQVLRLVRALREGPAAKVIVRHDQSRSRLPAGEVEAAGAVLVEDDGEIEWGEWSQLEVIVACLRRAAELGPDWTLLLSGQDYPLRPLVEIEAGLAACEADARLGSVHEIAPRPGGAGDEFFLRCAYRHYRRPSFVPHLPHALRPLVYVRDLPPQIGVRRPASLGRDLRGPVDRGMRGAAGRGGSGSVGRGGSGTSGRGGSGSVGRGSGRFARRRLRPYASADWLTLDPRALDAVLDAHADRRLVRWFRRVPVPSESFFATVLLNAPGLTVDGDDRRYAPFAGPGVPHPDTLTAADLDLALASGADFARKFDITVDARVLDLLDERRRVARPR